MQLIHALFIYTGRMLSIDSLFYYAPGESYSTFARTEFQPLFLEDVYGNMTTAQRTKAEQTCGDNKECLFDFAVTGGGKQTITYVHTYVLIYALCTSKYIQTPFRAFTCGICIH